MHLGLIGGIGPAATVAYYQRLCTRMRELGAPLELTIVQADIHALIRNNLADLREEQAAIYAALIERLRAAGAECAAITSLGGHFCFDETARISPLPLVSAVAPLDEHFARAGIRRVGLHGTRVVMRTRLYGQLRQTTALARNVDIEGLGRLYRDIAVSGVCATCDVISARLPTRVRIPIVLRVFVGSYHHAVGATDPRTSVSELDAFAGDTYEFVPSN